MIETYNIDNLKFETSKKFDIIFADYIYENLDFSWTEKFWNNLKPNGTFIAMTDFHSSHYYRVHMEEIVKAKFVNHLV